MVFGKAVTHSRTDRTGAHTTAGFDEQILNDNLLRVRPCRNAKSKNVPNKQNITNTFRCYFSSHRSSNANGNRRRWYHFSNNIGSSNSSDILNISSCSHSCGSASSANKTSPTSASPNCNSDSPSIIIKRRCTAKRGNTNRENWISASK